MISTRTVWRWECLCGQQNESPVWHLVDDRERADVLRVDAPGLITVACDGCGRFEIPETALLLVRSTTLARLLAVLSWGDLREPTARLSELQAALGNRVLGEPVIAPRILLPVLVSRDVDTDASDPGQAARAVRAQYGPEIGDTYEKFLALAMDQYADDEPRRLLDALVAVPLKERPAWLRTRPVPSVQGLVSYLNQITERADAAGDAGSSDLSQLTREMVAAVATATTSTEEIAVAYAAAVAENFDTYFRAEQDRSWAVATDRANGDAAVLALREVLGWLPDPDPTDRRRWAVARLASHLLATSDVNAIDEAIALLEDARSRSSAHDDLWAVATGNLAVAVGTRANGDIMDGWGSSVALLRAALTATDAEDRTMAINETNLGLALTDRPGSPSRDEMDEAISWLARGLARRTPEAMLEDWAYSKINLGYAYVRRGGPGDIEEAIGNYRDVADRLRGTPFARLLVYAELNLVSALGDAATTTPAEAVALASSAAAHADLLGDPSLLSWALRVQGDAVAADEGPLSSAAVASWQRSVDVIDPTVYPAQLLNNSGPLVDAYGAAEAWEPLATAYEQMLIAFDAYFNAQSTGDARRQVLAAHARLARWAAYALARSGRIAAAVEALERARTRELDVNTRRDTADLDAVGHRDPALAERYRERLAAYRAAATPQPPTRAATTAGGHSAVVASAALREVIDEIHGIPGLQRFLAVPTVTESLIAAGARQAIYVASAPAGTFVLRAVAEPFDEVARFDAVHVDLTSRDVAHMLLFDPDIGDPGLLFAQLIAAEPGGFERALAQLNARLEPIVRAIADLAAEVAPEPSVLILTGLAGLMPVQSLSLDPDGTTLDDVAELHLAPSIAVYAASRRRAARAIPAVFVGIADTDPAAPLPGCRGEVGAIAVGSEWSHVAIAFGADATLEWLTSNAPAASHLHLACHGLNNLDDPNGSQLILGRGDRLNISELVDRIPLHARLAVASACQSAHYDASVTPDEHVGLAAGFLRAGVACVVVSLWPVSDEAAALLMTRFYELLGTGSNGEPSNQAPQSALRQARLWLRGLTTASRSVYLDEHPVLGNALRSRGLPTAAPRGASRGPYDAVEDWGAFVAYGC
jgi:CHAT domain